MSNETLELRRYSNRLPRRLWICIVAAAVAVIITVAVPAQQLTVQQPSFGVSIDADGVLTTKSFADPTGKLLAKRLANARSAQPADMQGWSALRKISLVGL